MRVTALSFFSHAKTTEQTYTIIETGHSLGGFYAELNSCIFNGKAITYDSPGTLEILSSKTFRATWRTIASMKLKIPADSPDILLEDNYISFVSSPNIVNTAFGHIGRNVFRLYPYHVTVDNPSMKETTDTITTFIKGLLNPIELVPWAGAQIIKKLIEREALSHSLDQMIECLDPISGEPYLARRVISRPNRQQYKDDGIKTWARCKCFTEALLYHTSTANFAYEQLCNNIPSYKEGAFVIPELKDRSDPKLFEIKTIRTFSEFYQGDRFKNRLETALRQHQNDV